MDKMKRTSTKPYSCMMLRRRCPMLFMVLSSSCRLWLCILLIFGAGCLIGAFLAENLFTPSPKLAVLSERDGTVSKSREYSAPSQTETGVKTNVKLQEEGNIPGKVLLDEDYTTEKVLQEKDYLPRKVFVNCAVNSPYSLELFMETHPDSFMYDLYTFLVDTSYKCLYDKFSNLKLFTATILSNTSNTTLIALPDMSKPGEMNNAPVAQINFSAWLKDSLHRDDYVVVKLCPEPQSMNPIIKSIVETGAIEWVDKLYGSSADSLSQLMQLEGSKFEALEDKVFLWDDEMLMYSDFETINHPADMGEETVEVTECKEVEDDNGTRFALLLYAPSLNQHAYDALSLLDKIAKKHPFQLPVTLFLPLNYLEPKHHCGNLSFLASKMDLGLYFSGSFMSVVGEYMDGDEKQSNRVRNRLVNAEHCFKYAKLTLTYVLPEYALQQSSSLPKEGKKTKTMNINKLYKEVIYERGYTVMVGVEDVTHFAALSGKDLKQALESVETGLEAVDISVQGADTLLLRVLSAHVTSLIPAQECRMRGKMR